MGVHGLGCLVSFQVFGLMSQADLSKLSEFLLKECAPGVPKECFLDAFKFCKTFKQHPLETPGRCIISCSVLCSDLHTYLLKFHSPRGIWRFRKHLRTLVEGASKTSKEDIFCLEWVGLLGGEKNMKNQVFPHFALWYVCYKGLLGNMFRGLIQNRFSLNSYSIYSYLYVWL